MAGALRPAVLLIGVAAVLFFLDGILDGIYPGGPHGSLSAYSGIGWTSYLFAALNAVVAVLIARGSERTLALRIGLAAFFIVERPLSAILTGDKPAASMAVHALTALLEIVILGSTLRVWRLGHSVRSADLQALLETVAPSRAPTPTEGLAATTQANATLAPATALAPTGGISTRTSWRLGLLTLLLAALLVADALTSGYVPGATAFELDDPGWLAYVFALVALTVSARAVHGRRFALGLLLALSLIFFVERAFSPVVLRIAEPIALALHAAGAALALALAVVTAGAMRMSRARPAPLGRRSA